MFVAAILCFMYICYVVRMNFKIRGFKMGNRVSWTEYQKAHTDPRQTSYVHFEEKKKDKQFIEFCIRQKANNKTTATHCGISAIFRYVLVFHFVTIPFLIALARASTVKYAWTISYSVKWWIDFKCIIAHCIYIYTLCSVYDPDFEKNIEKIICQAYFTF